MTRNLEQAKRDVLVENTAQAVFKNINRLENHREKFKTRWAWELLQNARDSAKPEGVEVAFLVKNGRLVFRHSGKPFTDKNIAHLIYHGSSKVDESDPVGHFGTGFISTHLISKMVEVRGVLDGADCFNFTLDRRGKSPNDLQVSMEKSWLAFEQSVKPVNDIIENGYTTEYVYDLGHSEIIKAMVDEGLAQLRLNAGLMLAFNDSLRSLHLESNGRKTVFHKVGLGEKGEHCAYTRIQERDGDENLIDVMEIGSVSGEGITAAVPLTKDPKGRVLALEMQVPRLYVAFPLLGTEGFSLPCVINSNRFEPTEDRDGIYLARSETKDNTSNRALIEKGIEKATALLGAAAAEGWRASYKLAAIGEIIPADWLDRDWYKDVLTRKFLPVIRSSSLVPTRTGNRICPTESWIPIGHGAVTSREVWSLANGLKEGIDRLPIEEETERWSENLAGWATLLGKEATALDEAFGPTRLAKHIAGLSGIAQLASVIDDEVDAFQWLKKFYHALFTANQTDLFDEYAILPDQMGNFRLRKNLKLDQKSAGKSDEPIDSTLKEISEGLGDAVCERLLDRNIDQKGVMGLLQPLYQEELVTELADRVREQETRESITPDEMESNINLFAWALRNEGWKVLEGYPVNTRAAVNDKQAWQILSRSGSNRQENKLLAPCGNWPEVSRNYATIFPERFIISDAYYEACPEADCWNKLASHGYVFAGPLFHVEEKVRDFLPDEPLPEADDDESRLSSEMMRVSKIAFLTTEDIGILRTIRNSKRKAAMFLEFLVRAVLEIDQFALETEKVNCENSKQYTRYKGGWLAPIKRQKWVPIGDRKQSYINPESLGLLIKDSPGLMAAITEGQPALLMQALGVSISALSLQVLADEEDDRVTLIRSLTAISDAAGGNIEKIEELASEFKEDPELLAKIDKSRENRRRVEENQRVGALVEEIFKEMLESKGFIVKRTSIGSDYSVESDVIVDGEELGLSIEGNGRQFLVEIKSTIGDTVRMSIKQMETAVENTEEFVVCFVRLLDLPPNKVGVENECRFIFDIGSKVEGLWQELSGLRKAKENCATQGEEGDLTLEIDKLGVRLRIGREAWDTGKTLAEAVSIFSAVK